MVYIGGRKTAENKCIQRTRTWQHVDGDRMAVAKAFLRTRIKYAVNSVVVLHTHIQCTIEAMMKQSHFIIIY